MFTCLHTNFITVKDKLTGKPKTVEVACGKCLYCCVKKAKEWTIRLVHENRYYQNSCFLTLTYDNEHLPEDGSLKYSDVQLFLKRLRRFRNNLFGHIRYFACGEYGSRTDRPHYHIIIFGMNFAIDRSFLSISKKGSVLYKSDILNKLWGKGFCSIGEVNAKTASYIAKYSVQKVFSTDMQAHKAYVTKQGVIVQRPYIHMSKGIGLRWLIEFNESLLKGFIINENIRYSIPRYYYKKLEDLNLKVDIFDVQIIKNRVNEIISEKMKFFIDKHPINLYKRLLDIHECKKAVYLKFNTRSNTNVTTTLFDL